MRKMKFRIGTSRSHDVPDSSYCEFYSEASCAEDNKNKCITRQKCGTPGPESHNHCFTLWEFNANTGAVNIQMKVQIIKLVLIYVNVKFCV